MTITRLWQCGFEFGSTTAECSSSGVVSASTTKKKTGTYSGQMTTTASDASFGYVHTSGFDQFRMGFFMNHAGPSSGDTPNICYFKDGSTTILTLEYDATGGNFKIYSGTQAGSLLDTQSATAFAATDTWFHIGVDAKINASGWFHVYLDGSPIVSFGGDTTGAGTQVTSAYVGPNSGSDNWANNPYFDDIYLDTTTGEGTAAVVPSYQFSLIRPTAEGYALEWTPSSGTVHWQMVDETPPNSDTDYVTVAAPGSVDAYTMSTAFALPASNSITAVIPTVFARKVDAGGTVNLVTGTRLAGTNGTAGGTAALTTSYKMYFDRQTTDPGTGDWSEADAQALELVVVSV